MIVEEGEEASRNIRSVKKLIKNCLGETGGRRSKHIFLFLDNKEISYFE